MIISLVLLLPLTLEKSRFQKLKNMFNFKQPTNGRNLVIIPRLILKLFFQQSET